MLDQIAVVCVMVATTSIIQDAFMLSGFGALQTLKTHEVSFARHHAAMMLTLFVLHTFVAMIVQVWSGRCVCGSVRSAHSAMRSTSPPPPSPQFGSGCDSRAEVAPAARVRRCEPHDHIRLRYSALHCCYTAFRRLAATLPTREARRLNGGSNAVVLSIYIDLIPRLRHASCPFLGVR